jgi:hypothetical protein
MFIPELLFFGLCGCCGLKGGALVHLDKGEEVFISRAIICCFVNTLIGEKMEQNIVTFSEFVEGML